MPRVAVVTEALSPGFYFPLWYRYYASHVDPTCLFVVSHGGEASAFADYQLGGVLAMPSMPFDEGRRTQLIAPIVSGLLSHFDLVLHTDTDEFLVPDPRRYKGLGAYLETLKVPYVTAIGLDVFQHAREAPVDWSRPLLAVQRHFAYLSSSMCKTAVTAVPLQWGPGFHFCSVFPRLNDLFLVHLKRADIDQQLEWFAYMSGRDFADERLRAYYAPSRDRLERLHRMLSARPLLQGWDGIDRAKFRGRFLGSICFDRMDGIYRGVHFQDDVICELPAEFCGML